MRWSKHLVVFNTRALNWIPYTPPNYRAVGWTLCHEHDGNPAHISRPMNDGSARGSASPFVMIWTRRKHATRLRLRDHYQRRQRRIRANTTSPPPPNHDLTLCAHTYTHTPVILLECAGDSRQERRLRVFVSNCATLERKYVYNKIERKSPPAVVELQCVFVPRTPSERSWAELATCMCVCVCSRMRECVGWRTGVLRRL